MEVLKSEVKKYEGSLRTTWSDEENAENLEKLSLFLKIVIFWLDILFPANLNNFDAFLIVRKVELHKINLNRRLELLLLADFLFF